MIRCFGVAVVCSSFGLLFLSLTPVMGVVGLTLALFAAVNLFWDVGRDRAQLHPDFYQLLH